MVDRVPASSEASQPYPLQRYATGPESLGGVALLVGDGDRQMNSALGQGTA